MKEKSERLDLRGIDGDFHVRSSAVLGCVHGG
jgi:hypothetical protein